MKVELKKVFMTITDAAGNVKMKRKVAAHCRWDASPIITNNYIDRVAKDRVKVYYEFIEECDLYANFTVGKHTLLQQSFKIINHST